MSSFDWHSRMVAVGDRWWPAPEVSPGRISMLTHTPSPIGQPEHSVLSVSRTAR